MKCYLCNNKSQILKDGVCDKCWQWRIRCAIWEKKNWPYWRGIKIFSEVNRLRKSKTKNNLQMIEWLKELYRGNLVNIGKVKSEIKESFNNHFQKYLLK